MGVSPRKVSFTECVRFPRPPVASFPSFPPNTPVAPSRAVAASLGAILYP